MNKYMNMKEYEKISMSRNKNHSQQYNHHTKLTTTHPTNQNRHNFISATTTSTSATQPHTRGSKQEQELKRRNKGVRRGARPKDGHPQQQERDPKLPAKASTRIRNQVYLFYILIQGLFQSMSMAI